MVCNICGKNQATVHLTEIIDEQITELHLCEECAQKKGAQMESHFGLSDLLAGLADLGTQFNKTKTDSVKLKCPKCGLTYEDFKKVGRLGCGECYAAFKEALVPLLKRIHGSTQHFGKAPKKIAKVVKVKNELEVLKEKLQKAINKEDFEEAAKLRDKIRDLDKKSGK
jgi:protein arginine kinase activator